MAFTTNKKHWIAALLATGLSLFSVPARALTYTVTNTSASGTGSLHEAIDKANTALGKDTIVFAIAGVITPAGMGALSVTDEVLIDGYSAPGSDPATLDVAIEIDGALLGSIPGLTISADKCIVRGLAIYNCEAGAIRIIGNVKDNRIEGNILGTDNVGLIFRPNTIGVEIDGARDNRIGGDTADARNWIVAGDGATDPAYFGIHIHDEGATGNKVWNNLIGTNREGTDTMGSFSVAGVYIENANANQIGGAGDIYRNYIVGATGNGISIVGGSDNRIRGNFIGTGVAGNEPLGNVAAGVYIDDSSFNVVGGLLPGEGNLVCFNGYGVEVTDGTNNAILGNAILNNPAGTGSGLGIDLGMDGVTHNDWFLDGDEGPNDLQNFPVLTDAVLIGGDDLVVTGYICSNPGRTYRIEFFWLNACDPSDYGEGAHYLGSIEVTIPILGFGRSFRFSPKPSGLDVTDVITATATELTGKIPGNTSEFSRCFPIRFLPISLEPAVVFPVYAASTAGHVELTIQVKNHGPGEAHNVVATVGAPGLDATGMPTVNCVTSADIISAVDYGTVLEGDSTVGNGLHTVDVSNCSEDLVLPLTIHFENPQTSEIDSVVSVIVISVSDIVATNPAALPEVNAVASRVRGMNQNGWDPAFATGDVLMPGGAWRPTVWARVGQQWTRTLLPALDPSGDAAVLGLTGEQNNDIVGEQNNDIFAVGYALDGNGVRNGALWVKDGSNPWTLQVFPSPNGQPYQANSILQTSDGLYVGGSTTSSGVEAGVIWFYDFDQATWVNSILCEADIYFSLPVMEEMSLGITGEQNNDIVAMGSRPTPNGGPAIAITVVGDEPGDPMYIDMPLPPGFQMGAVQAGDPTTSMFAGVVVGSDSYHHVVIWPEYQGTWVSVMLPDAIPNMTNAVVTGIGGQQASDRIIVGHATSSSGTVPFVYRENSNGDWVPSLPLYVGDGLRAHRIMGVDKKGRMVAEGIALTGNAVTDRLMYASVPANELHAMYISSDIATGVIVPPPGFDGTTLQVNAYPNPFNPSVTISFAAPKSTRTVVKVYDVNGALVTTLLDRHIPAGEHSLTWNGTNGDGIGVATGVYFVRVQTTEQAATRKLVLLK